MDQLVELEGKLNKELDEEESREQLYNTQANDIATQLMARKVDDGYYIWSYRRSPKDSNKYFIVAARKLMIGTDGYRPMTAEFEPDQEKTLFQNVSEVVKMMLKRQNGEYDSSQVEAK